MGVGIFLPTFVCILFLYPPEEYTRGASALLDFPIDSKHLQKPTVRSVLNPQLVCPLKIHGEASTSELSVIALSGT